MNHLNELTSNKMMFFNFMKEKYPIFFNSNIFLRDIQYAIRTYFKRKDVEIAYPLAEKLAMDFTKHLEEKNELVRLSSNSWKVNFSFPKPVEEVEGAVLDKEV